MSDELRLQAQARALAPYLRTLVFTPFSAESTYTPTYVGGTTAGVTTYSVQQGAWVRLGKIVHATGTLQWTNATGTGDARISLPFASANVSNQNHGGSVWLSSVTFANSTPLVLISPNTSYFVLSSPLTNAANTQVAIEVAGVIVFSLWYLRD